MVLQISTSEDHNTEATRLTIGGKKKKVYFVLQFFLPTRTLHLKNVRIKRDTLEKLKYCTINTYSSVIEYLGRETERVFKWS